MSLQGERILVTGAGGFIGSHLAERLVREGAHVRAMVHYNALGSRGWLDGSEHAADMEIIAGDVTDADCVQGAARGVDRIAHLAALIGIPYSYTAPRSYLRVNAEGTLNILQAVRDAGIRRVVHTSTSEVYGSAQRIPIDENHPLCGQSPYAASKTAADQLALSFARSFDIPVVTVRPFNTFGPRQSLRAVIPTIIAQCLAIAQGSSPPVIRLGAAHTTRDLNHVDDTVAGFVRALEADVDADGSAFNLGSGREISIADLAHAIADLCGIEADIATDQQRLRPDASEVDRLLADASRAQRLLGWTPEIALEDGLLRTIEWFRVRTPGEARAGAFVV